MPAFILASLRFAFGRPPTALGTFLLALLLSAAPTAAAPPVPVVLAPGQTQADLAGHIEVLHDPEGRLTIGEVTAPPLDDAFRPIPRHLNEGYTQEVIWLRFRVATAPPSPVGESGWLPDWWLEMMPPYVDDITVFSPAPDGRFQARQTGDRQPMSSRDMVHPNFVLRFSPPPAGDQATYYIRIQTTSSMMLAPHLITTALLISRSQTDLMFQALIYGATGMMFLMAMLLGIGLRHRVFLLYALYTLSNTGVQFGQDGLLARFLTPESPLVSDRLVNMLAPLAVAAGTWFVAELLDLRKQLPRLDRLYRGTALAMVPCALTAGLGYWGKLAGFVNLTALIFLLLTMVSAVVLVFRRVPSALFFLSGFSVHVGTLAHHVLRHRGVLPMFFGIDWAVHIGVLIHVAAIGLGIANRIRLREKGTRAAEQIALAMAQEAEARLEARVNERTAALKVEIEERRRATEGIAASERRWRTFLATIPLPVVISRMNEGTIFYANDAFLDMFGLAAEDLPQCRPESLYALPDDRVDLLAEVARTNLVHGLEVPLRTRNGRQFWASLSAALVDLDGAPCLFAAITDISVLKEQERVLREAKENAEAAMRTKSSFLAMMSHEIRTPMTGIISVGDLLMETPLTAEQRDWLHIIIGSGQSLLTILNDILDFSKLEQDHLRLEHLPFNLVQLVESTAALLRSGAEAKQIGWKVEIGEDLPRQVRGDPTRLRQILLNLLGNALKFTDQGQVSLTLRQIGETKGKALIRIAIADTGIGIAPEAQARLFAPFSQADSSISRRYGGTGLGLAISHRLAGMMGGTIDVESRVGEGSRFTLTLSFQPVAAVAAEPSSLPLPSLPPLSLLLAEDNRVNAKVAQALLSRHGHRVTLVQNGAEAVQAVACHPPGHFDLVLMDMQMPQMDGLEATRLIRALGDTRARLPIIAMTANAFDSDRDLCRQAGMDGYVSKPVAPATLLAEMKRVLEERIQPAAEG